MYVHGFFFRILRRSWEFLTPADLRNSAPTRYSGVAEYSCNFAI